MTHDPNEGPLLMPHAFVPGPRGVEHACKLCGLLPSSPRHALETPIADDRPSIAELQSLIESKDRIDEFETTCKRMQRGHSMILRVCQQARSAPLLLEIAAAALALDAAFDRDYSTMTALAGKLKLALAKVRP